jgi:hypothetical protein
MSSEVKAVADGAGFTTALTSVYLYIADKLNVIEVNQYLVTITSIGGLIWLVYKIRGQHLDNKIKKKQLDKDN